MDGKFSLVHLFLHPFFQTKLASKSYNFPSFIRTQAWAFLKPSQLLKNMQHQPPNGITDCESTISVLTHTHQLLTDEKQLLLSILPKDSSVVTGIQISKAFIPKWRAPLLQEHFYSNISRGTKALRYFNMESNKTRFAHSFSSDWPTGPVRLSLIHIKPKMLFNTELASWTIRRDFWPVLQCFKIAFG